MSSAPRAVPASVYYGWLQRKRANDSFRSDVNDSFRSCKSVPEASVPEEAPEAPATAIASRRVGSWSEPQVRSGGGGRVVTVGEERAGGGGGGGVMG